MSIHIEQAREQFQRVFGAPAEFAVRAPGRVNIIGEHTDYNHGFVLPMAIERETVMVARRAAGRTLVAHAANLGRQAAFDLGQPARNPEDSWLDYLAGVAHELGKLGKPLLGAEVLVLGDVPLGCGLSSSAALEMAALCLFEALGDFRLEGAAAAQLGQRVENDFLGLSSGIMDQFISRCGRREHALFLDCRSHEYDLVPVAMEGACFVIANTCCTRGLTASKYNERVAECQQAVDAMRTAHKREEATHLRDFSLENLLACEGGMDPIAFRRARHVITEDERTKAACEAMRAGDAARLGELMDASDASLRDDYAVTSKELDAMTAAARALPACFGARMTGAGFGGCTINLVESAQAEAFGQALLREYQQRTGIQGELIISNPAQGAEILG